MNIALAMRFQGMENAGLGRISSEIQKGMESRGHTVLPFSIDKKGLVPYLKYSLFDMANNCFRCQGEVDVYHAVSPVECLWMPPNKTIVTIADLIPVVVPKLAGAGQNRTIIHREIIKQYFKFCARVATKKRMIVTISELTKGYLMDYLHVPEKRIRVIRLGISEDLRPGPKPDNIFRIGYLGQLDRRKRVHLLIKAFKKAKVDGELLIAGSGVDKDKLKKLAEGDHRIKFLGFIPDNGLARFYNSLDLFVFPSAVEGYGLPVVEAMACKKPVLLLDDSIIPEELTDNCVLKNHINIEANYEFAKSHSWPNAVREYEKLYQEVANG